MLCLVLRWGTAGEEQFTCTEVRMAGSHMPFLTRAKLSPGPSLSQALVVVLTRVTIPEVW